MMSSDSKLKHYLPIIEKKDAVIRNAYRTLRMAAIVIWKLDFARKQIRM